MKFEKLCVIGSLTTDVSVTFNDLRLKEVL